jgi:hypothetical protein
VEFEFAFGGFRREVRSLIAKSQCHISKCVAG